MYRSKSMDILEVRRRQLANEVRTLQQAEPSSCSFASNLPRTAAYSSIARGDTRALASGSSEAALRRVELWAELVADHTELVARAMDLDRVTADAINESQHLTEASRTARLQKHGLNYPAVSYSASGFSRFDLPWPSTSALSASAADISRFGLQSPVDASYDAGRDPRTMLYDPRAVLGTSPHTFLGTRERSGSMLGIEAQACRIRASSLEAQASRIRAASGARLRSGGSGAWEDLGGSGARLRSPRTMLDTRPNSSSMLRFEAEAARIKANRSSQLNDSLGGGYEADSFHPLLAPPSSFIRPYGVNGHHAEAVPSGAGRGLMNSMSRSLDLSTAPLHLDEPLRPPIYSAASPRRRQRSNSTSKLPNSPFRPILPSRAEVGYAADSPRQHSPYRQQSPYSNNYSMSASLNSTLPGGGIAEIRARRERMSREVQRLSSDSIAPSWRSLSYT